MLGVKITKTGRIYFLLSIVLILAGMNTRTNLLHLLTSFMISLWIISAFLVRLNVQKLRIDLYSQGETFVNEESIVEYVFRNDSVYSKYGVSVSDKTINYDFSCLHIPAKTSLTVSHSQVFSKREVKTWDKLLVGTSFPFGFFRNEEECSIKGSLYVLPKPLMIKTPLPILAQVMAPEEGVMRKVVRNADQHFAGLREYTPGDAPRRIHWKASAKAQQLMVKEHEDEVPQKITLIMDTSEESLLSFSSPRFPNQLESLISLTASLLKDFSQRKLLFRLVFSGQKQIFKEGEQHLREGLRFLTTASLDNQDMVDYSSILENCPPNSSVILISSHLGRWMEKNVERFSATPCQLFLVCLERGFYFPDAEQGQDVFSVKEMQDGYICLERCYAVDE